ncbi:type VI secretion system baseplate subunit TssG [Swingsia samuiensis]|uniref:Type VI secretion system baseplate subunit TssG n=1 Tax=Swingsia samuiensis TaxID=1293412 RepID=A0A4Y6UFK2_9PROT|nr:type VI secretion system baseplate subunit TssG [Swingsia samuiensis]QDH16332.1 type VI secretion system baseplate subunit TssG [Swingsia samuiensis]
MSEQNQPSTPALLENASLEELVQFPGRFSFDAAMALLQRLSGNRPLSEIVRFRTPPGLVTPNRDILNIEPQPDGTFDVWTSFGTMTGHDGILPRPYSALVDEEHRSRSPALSSFLDMLAQRPRIQFADAGTKYSAHSFAPTSTENKNERLLARVLFALTGFHSSDMVQRGQIDPRYLLYFSGLFATQPRSAERLRTILEEWMGTAITINQFSGQWISVPPQQQSQLPNASGGQFSQLGVDAIIGSHSWDLNARIEIQIGPLSLKDYRNFLPHGMYFTLLKSLIRIFIDDEVTCVLRLGLKKEDVPDFQFNSIHLGRDSWVPQKSKQKQDLFDTIIPISARD